MRTVSVIVPVYHTPVVKLRNCIASLLQQTYDNLEIIVVDDGNPDEYQYIFDDIEKSDERIRVFHQENSGVSAARNCGISHATGELLSFVDSDDFLDCSFYTKMVQAVEDNDIAICGVVEFFPTIDISCDRRSFFSHPSSFHGFQYVNFSVNKLYWANYIREHDICFPLNVALGEDAIFVSEYFKYCNSFRIIPDMLYHYVSSQDSAVNSYKEAYWSWEKLVVSLQWEMFHQYPLTVNEENAVHAWLFRKLRTAAYYYLDREKEKRITDKYLREIVSFDLFQDLRRCDLSKNNLHLSVKEKITITTWRILGEKGIRLIYSV